MQIYLAPMEGITTFVYRNALHRYYGGIDKFFTPFLSSPKLNYKEVNEILPEHNAGLYLVPQILANRADVFLAIAEQLSEYGYREINLNLGCPSATVTSRKRGAGFLSVPGKLDAFLAEVFEKCPLEISIKTRIGISSTDEWEDILAVYAKYPLKELIIHPRLQQEFYNGSPHPEAFRQAADSLQTSLCYNGDITSKAALEALAEKLPFLTTVMLGRGVLANPELPAGIKNTAPLATTKDTELPHAAKNTSLPPAAKKEASAVAKDLKTFAAFHDELLEGYTELMSGEQPVLFRMKELWTYMGNYLDLSDKEMKQIRKVSRLQDYRNLFQIFLSARVVS